MVACIFLDQCPKIQVKQCKKAVPMIANLKYKFKFSSSQFQYRKYPKAEQMRTKGKTSRRKSLNLGRRRVKLMEQCGINQMVLPYNNRTHNYMNKTVYKTTQARKRQLQTQSNFRSRTPISPFPRQKSFQQSNWRSDQPKVQSTLPKQYAVSSSHWCLYDSKTRNFIGLRENHQRQVASLTKIMTTLVSLELFQRYAMEKDVMIRISATSAALSGTTAQLKQGKYIQLYDLFYGAMLPSGNDAALLLSQVFGLLLFYESLKPQTKDYSQIQSIDLTCYDSTTTFVSRFLKQMNKKAKQLHLHRTSFANPHGLSNILNVSSAKDMIMLSRYVYNNAIFRQIMNCEQYRVDFYAEDMQKVHCVKIWNNTNKLLKMGWEGIKTGQTPAAGSCLASYRDGIYIVVLNSSSREARFQDTVMLWQWHQNNTNMQ